MKKLTNKYLSMIEQAISEYIYQLLEGIKDGILIYAIGIYFGYTVLAILSRMAMVLYRRKNSFVNYNTLLSTDFVPSVSIIAPAFNEAVNIVDNVRSLLSLHYTNFEVIIVNDGSRDNTLELLIKEYELEKTDIHINESIETKEVLGVYKAKNPAYRKLLVVDKKNGGKADALNVGINVSRNRLIACVDVDCILEPDAIIKMVKPFMENKKVIATGGVLRIANSCEVRDGLLVNVKVPKNFLARVQVLEYFRAFLMARMAWSYLDGLLLISGAFGMFNKATVIRAGGYNTKTVGEDMELLVRMRRMIYEEKKVCKVAFIPDPLCWTEVPERLSTLVRQRNRWTRGSAETLMLHRKMALNPRYGIYGMLSLPFWFVFEWLTPLIEFLGFFIFISLASIGMISWAYFFIALGLAYSYGVMYSVFAIYFEERSYQQYKKPKHMLKLLVTAFLEPIFYHPLILWAAVKGNYDLLRGRTKWGKMSRIGFGEKKLKNSVVNSEA